MGIVHKFGRVGKIFLKNLKSSEILSGKNYFLNKKGISSLT